MSRFVVSFPGRGQDLHERQDLAARETADGSGLVLELHEQQLGHEVIRRVFGAPVDVVAEELVVGEVIRAVPVRLARFAADPLVGLPTDGLLIFLRDAEQHPDHAHRHLGAEVDDEVEALVRNQRVEHVCAVRTDLRLERVHLLRGEDPGEHAAMRGVHGRVLHDEHPARRGVAGLDRLQHAAVRGAERVVVDEAALDVLEAAQRVEVVLLVVIERCFLAETPKHRVRIHVDVDVIGVEGDLALRRDAHREERYSRGRTVISPDGDRGTP